MRFIVCLIFYSVLISVLAEEASLLSIEETIHVAKTQLIDTSPDINYYKRKFRGNPAARSELYKILADPAQKKYWSNVAGYFSYIGEQEDIDKLIGLYDKKEGLLDDTALDIIAAIRKMAMRGVPGARAKLDEMKWPSYWKNKKYQMFPYHYPEDREMTYENYSACWIINCPAGWGDDHLQVIESVIMSVPDQKQRELMRKKIAPWISPEALEARKNDPFKQALEWRLSWPSQPITQKEDKIVSRMPRVITDDISPLIAQALDAYGRLYHAFVAQKYEESAPWFLKDGKPFLSEKIERNEENIKSIAKKFEEETTLIQRKSLETMVGKARGAKYSNKLGPAEVKIVNVKKCVELERGSGKYTSIANKTTTIVRIPCPGAFWEQYISSPPSYYSLTKKRELVIVMMKINDDWFWSPFGW